MFFFLGKACDAYAVSAETVSTVGLSRFFFEYNVSGGYALNQTLTLLSRLSTAPTTHVESSGSEDCRTRSLRMPT